MVEQTRSEDSLILFLIDPKITNIDRVLGELNRFFKRKQEIDGTDRFNFVAFESNGPVYFEDFLFETQYISDALAGLKGELGRPNPAGAIMVAVTFIIDVFKLVGGKVYRIIALTDQNTPPLVNIEVLQTLMDQVREFPVFMDIIRINTNDPKEDLKLMRFAKTNNGEVLYAKNEKELGKVLDEVAKKKKVLKSSDGGEKYTLAPDSERFFYNLAQDPWDVEEVPQGTRCLICGDTKQPLIKCPKCNTISHAPCLAQWAKMSNIGIPHVFRCMQCYNLLRLPKPFVLDVQSGAYQKRIQVQAADQNALLRAQQSKAAPQLKKVEDPLAGMLGGDEMGWANAADDFVMEEDKDLQVQFCPNCGTLNFPESVKCIRCDARLR
jgi:hypothetical protein